MNRFINTNCNYDFRPINTSYNSNCNCSFNPLPPKPCNNFYPKFCDHDFNKCNPCNHDCNDNCNRKIHPFPPNPQKNCGPNIPPFCENFSPLACFVFGYLFASCTRFDF